LTHVFPFPAIRAEQAKEEMRAKEALLRNFFANVEVVLRAQRSPASTAQRWGEEEGVLQQELGAAQRRVHEALCDNINTQVGSQPNPWCGFIVRASCTVPFQQRQHMRVFLWCLAWHRVCSDLQLPCARPPLTLTPGRHGRAV
jgi:hypothetical protein